MSLQFNCPYCGLLMTSDPRLAGGQAQCPSCRQLFMIGGAVATMPIVQARSAEPVVKQPAAPPPGRPAAPPVRKPAKPGVASHAKSDSAGKNLAGLAIAGILLAGFGLIYGGIRLIGSMEEKAASVSQFDVPPEVKARDAAKVEEWRKIQADEEAEKAKRRQQVLDLLALSIFGGDKKVAGELVKELEAISEELDTIRSDADADNDPRDLREFWTKRLEEHVGKNNVLHHWLGGKPPAMIAALLWGDDGSSQRSRGKVADFLLAGSYSSTGTGFFVSDEGWLLTNQHVVGTASEVDVRGVDGVIKKARVVKADAEADVALLKIESRPSHWLHVQTQEAQMGADVCTVGFPNADIQGVEPKYTTGTVSSLSGVRDDRENYQTTVPVQPGNSGGPLVDMKSGDVIGIVASILRHDRGAENVSYAIKGSVVERVLDAVPDAKTALAKSASDSRGSIPSRSQPM